MSKVETVTRETKEYFDGDDLATNVFITKYALRDKEGDFRETNPNDMHIRLAGEFARIEDKFNGNKLTKENIFDSIKGFKKIVPQGSPMYGIGNNFVNVSLSNCVVVDSPKDNISSIVDSGKDLANLFKRRCGVGLDISELRPEGAPVSNSAGTTTGAWSFADFYSYVCRMVGQNGRRGALMITMDVRHPDIEADTLCLHAQDHPLQSCRCTGPCARRSTERRTPSGSDGGRTDRAQSSRDGPVAAAYARPQARIRRGGRLCPGGISFSREHLSAARSDGSWHGSYTERVVQTRHDLGAL